MVTMILIAVSITGMVFGIDVGTRVVRVLTRNVPDIRACLGIRLGRAFGVAAILCVVGVGVWIRPLVGDEPEFRWLMAYFALGFLFVVLASLVLLTRSPVPKRPEGIVPSEVFVRNYLEQDDRFALPLSVFRAYEWFPIAPTSAITKELLWARIMDRLTFGQKSRRMLAAFPESPMGALPQEVDHCSWAILVNANRPEAYLRRARVGCAVALNLRRNNPMKGYTPAGGERTYGPFEAIVDCEIAMRLGGRSDVIAFLESRFCRALADQFAGHDRQFWLTVSEQLARESIRTATNPDVSERRSKALEKMLREVAKADPSAHRWRSDSGDTT